MLINRRRFLQFTFAASAILLGPRNARAQNSVDALLDRALAGEHRAVENRARDRYRHPKETLKFFGLRPDLTVVELWPGGGWYTEILAPFLRPRGKLYAAGFATDDPATPKYRLGIQQKFAEKLAALPAIYDQVVVTQLAPPKFTDIAPAASADLVLTFRNVHNWLQGGVADQVFAAAFQALRPGGVLGVVEHRAPDDWSVEQMIERGYVSARKVMALATDAGFELAQQTEINANPEDTKDYPKGVWTLPPMLRLGEQDRGKYLAIGESDRMTLKFVKPER